MLNFLIGRNRNCIPFRVKNKFKNVCELFTHFRFKSPHYTRSFLQPSFSHSIFSISIIFFSKGEFLSTRSIAGKNLLRHFDVTSSVDLPWDRGYLSGCLSPLSPSISTLTHPYKERFPPFSKVEKWPSPLFGHDYRQ